MNSTYNHGLFGIAFSVMATVILAGTASAQIPLSDGTEFADTEPAPIAEIPIVNPIVNPVEVPVANPSRIQLVESIPSSSHVSAGRPTVAQLRQARAQYRTQQRIQRMERNLWAGYEPLRPNWNAVPMMSSRYPYRNRILVPYYVYPR